MVVGVMGAIGVGLKAGSSGLVVRLVIFKDLIILSRVVRLPFRSGGQSGEIPVIRIVDIAVVIHEHAQRAVGLARRGPLLDIGIGGVEQARDLCLAC